MARALITNPQILLLDEPLSALDPFLRVRMRAELRQLQERLGIPFIHVTHSQDEALALADLVVVMNKGRIEQAGAPREVFERPATEFVARFLGGHNVLPTPMGKVAVRADRIKLVAGGAARRLSATVSGLEYLGTHYQVALESGAIADLSASVGDAAFAAAPFTVGDSIGLDWADADGHQLLPTPG